MTLHLLTDADVEILKELVAWRKGQNVPQIRVSERDPEIPAPEVYLAKPPSTGIPALQRTASTPSSGDIPGVAECQIFRIYDLGTGTPVMEESSASDKRVFNYSTSEISGEHEWISIIRTKDGKWVAVSSNPSSIFATPVSGVCSCSCIDNGDITVDGYETTSRWSVVLPELFYEETYGTVYLPAGEYLLDWNSGAGYWVCDISADLIAYYTDGTPYSIPTTGTGSTVSGSIIFRHSDSGYESLEIEWSDNIIPAPTGT